ncbi:MAG: chemotaxis response regulator protein-glutamate methylesterase [Candidatus Methylomirabilis sp.]|nr:chemotaxis response regulator protein-glutamate methylesterase [Deltaproteobacteria bacterium]
MSKIRVLVVDDSAFMRRVLKQMLETDPGIEVAGTARDGAEGVSMALELKPDVVTMDVEMPKMNGLEATEALMERMPVPILMVSSITKEGAKATFEAMDKGAADYISKNLVTSALDLMKIQDELITKVKAIARRKHHFVSLRTAKPGVQPPVPVVKKGLASLKIGFISIGASTGGPRAVQAVLANLPAGLDTSILVSVHMPRMFTGAFAERMNEVCKLPVKEAENGESVGFGKVFISPGGLQTRVRRKGLTEFFFQVDNEPRDAMYRPSIDISMSSVAESYPGRSLGVILTGMGSDGREGMRLIKEKGGKTIAQDEHTCTVYGMPKSVIEAGLADKVVPLELIAAEIINMI